MLLRRHFGLLLMLAALAGVWAVSPRGAADEATSPAAADAAAGAVWTGSTSCAAYPCHGGNGARGAVGSEHTTWVTFDPHAGAYSALRNDKSSDIVRRLKDTPAEQNKRCLCCHAELQFKLPENDSRRASRDGGSCESCHGPAGRWLSVHNTWGEKSRTEKDRLMDELGMFKTKDLVVRGRQCVRCHVGDKDHEVNHDLIAAGHPRLNFEYGAYLANLPKHWDKKEEKKRLPDLEARAWAAGQALSAAAALDLMAERADPKNGKSWPELAEYDCFSCHHDLAPQFRRRTGGRLVWSDWYVAMADVMAGSEPDMQRMTGPLKELRDLMQEPARNRVRIAAAASALARNLRQPLDKTQAANEYSGRWLENMLSTLEKDALTPLADPDWDQEVQWALALEALYQTRKDLGNPVPEANRKSLNKLLDRLRFPDSYNSPHDESKNRPSGVPRPSK